MASVGGRLRELRAAAGLTQEELAGRAGVSLAAVRNYEQGKREPSWRAFLDLCKALGAEPMSFDGCAAGEVPPRVPPGKPPRRERR